MRASKLPMMRRASRRPGPVLHTREPLPVPDQLCERANPLPRAPGGGFLTYGFWPAFLRRNGVSAVQNRQ